jgi:hypothetical protein
MKTVVPSVLLTLALACSGFSATPAAAATATKSETPAARGLAGKFKGSWKGSDQNSGELRLSLTRDGEDKWTAEASFTFEGNTIPTRMKTARVDGTKIELLFEWDADGNVAHSKTTGELKGDKLEGDYVTGGGAGEKRGTWTVTRV